MNNRDGSDGRDARGEHFIDRKQLSPEQYILKDSPNDIRNFGWFQTHAHARLRWKIGSFWCESKIDEPKIDDTMEHFSAKKIGAKGHSSTRPLFILPILYFCAIW